MHKEKTIQSILGFSILTFTISFILYQYDKKIHTTVLITSLIIMGILLLINVYLSIYLKTKYTRKNFHINIKTFIDKTENEELNYEKSIKTIKKLEILGIINVVVLVLSLTTMISSTLLLALSNESGYIPVLIISLYFVGGLVYAFSYKSKNRHGMYLPEFKCIDLYSLIREVRDDLGIKDNFSLYLLLDNNIAISKVDKVIHLRLGIYTLMILSRDELKSVIYHEFGHLLNKNSNSLYSRYRFLDQMNSISNLNGVFSISYIFFFGIYKYIEHKYHLNQIVISKTIENESDQVVINKGLNKENISALIKMSYLGYFLSSLDTKSTILKSIAYPLDYFDNILKEFLDIIPLKKEKYNQYISNELDSKRATHPPLRIRMTNFGINNFDILPISNYNDNELKVIISDLITELNKLQYQNKNLYMTYQKQLDIIKEYDEETENSINSKLIYAQALYNTHQIEEAYKIYVEIDKKNSEIAEVQYYLGAILLSYYDDEKGIDYIYKAIDLIPSQIHLAEIITLFAIRMGRLDILEKNRSYTLNKTKNNISKKIDLLDYIDIKTKIKPGTLDSNILNQIKEIAKTYNLYEVYVIEKELNRKTNSNLILVHLDDKSETVHLAIDEIFRVISNNQNLIGVNIIPSKQIYLKVSKITKPFYERPSE